MGKRKLAATTRGFNHATSQSCFNNEGITAHLRGWDFGIEITMRHTENGPMYEFWLTGGSNNPGRTEQMFLTDIDEDAI